MFLRKSPESNQAEWTHDELAEAAGVSRQTVKRSIEDLLDARFISVVKKGGRWQKAIYGFNPDRLEPSIDVDLSQERAIDLPVGRGAVYFIGNTEEKIVKIGFSMKGATERMSAIQTGCPYRLSVLKTVEKTTLGGELIIQGRFEAYKMNGEWFSITGELAEYLDN